MPFAFSLSHFVSSVGADAGFASIIGLAILVLLYFAHAREAATLREEAAESAHRVQKLEAQLAQLMRRQAAAGRQATVTPPPAGVRVEPAATGEGAPSARERAAAAWEGAGAGAQGAAAGSSGAAAAGAIGAATAAGASSRVAAAASIPTPPAGVGAPPLSAATKLVPTEASVEQRERGVPAVAGSDAPIEATAVVPAPGPEDGGGNGLGPDAELTGHMPLDPEEPRAGELDEDEGAAPIAVAPPPVGARTTSARTGASSGRGTYAPPRVNIRPGGAASRSSMIQPQDRKSRRDGTGRRFLLLIGALAVIAVVAVLLLVTGSPSNKSTSSGSPTSNASARPANRRSAPFSPANVTVAVLNGTATPGLAHRVSQQLSSDGYKQGTVATAADQTRTATVVSYMPGHRHDALEVASAIKLGSASVQPIDSSTQAVACPPPAGCAATVVVTVGSDLTSQ